MTGMKESGDIGEADKSILVTTIDDMVQGTEFEGFSSQSGVGLEFGILILKVLCPLKCLKTRIADQSG